MEHEFESLLRRLKLQGSKHRRWLSVVCLLSGIVATCTVASLSRDAFAQTVDCGIPEHTHTDGCYAPAPAAEPVPVCGKDGTQIHVHDEACYDSDGNLVCQIPELTEHVHDESCFPTEEDTPQETVLVCEEQEHVHTDLCQSRTPETDPETTPETDGELMAEAEAETMPDPETGTIGGTLGGDYAYIRQLTVTKTVDGSNPFDDDDAPGNDSGASNGIVRSFDSLSYTLNIGNRVRENSPCTYYKEGTLCFEFVLPVSADEATFEPDKMAWLNAKPQAEYNVTEGTYNGSPAVILRGSFLWQPSEGNDTAIGESYIELDVALRVLAMHQGQTLQPLFTFWLEGNQVPEDGCVTGSGDICPDHGRDYVTVFGDEVTISSTPRFNLAVVQGGQQVLGTFDFSTGNEQALNKGAGNVYGRVSNYGLVLQIYGKTEAHGLRGCELPDGSNITFDVAISSSYRYYDTAGSYEIDAAENGFAPLVWCFGQNQYTGKQDNRITAGSYANGITFNVPYNKAGDDPEVFRSCYDGGSWSAVQSDDGKTLHITVSDYQVNLNSLPYTYAAASAGDYRYYNPNTISGCWDVQKACFAAGELWVVQPFTDAGGVSVAKRFQSGSFTMHVQEQCLAAAGQSGSLPEVTDNSNQMVTDDDAVSTGVALQLPGSLSYDIAYQAPGNPNPWNTPLAYGCWENGKDWVVAGGQLRIFDYIQQTNCEGDERGVAYDQLVKFDSDFLEPTYALEYYTNTMHGMTFHAGYGVVAESSDAGTPTEGWNHHGKKPDEEGYDTEMINATADDLIFFTSMNEVKARGYKCVAVLFEMRGACDTPTLHTNAFIRANVTTDQSRAGNVYMITHAANVWAKADVRDAAAEYCGKNPGTLTDEDFYKYATEVFPSRLGENPGEQLRYSDYPNYPNNYINLGPDGSDAESNAGFRNYQKSVYDENGWASGTSGTQYGDSCILMEYTTAIQKSVAQTTGTGEKKVTYSMDDAQRYADFQLIGSTSIGVNNQTDSASSWMTTTVYMEDTLPKDLHYVEGSSAYGGEYVQTAEGKRGLVNGGQPITPEVIANADGTTTLRYTIENVALNLNKKTVLPTIFYSCLIGDPGNVAKDVTNMQKLVNTAKIWSAEDYFRPFAPENENLTSFEIDISKLKQGNISKLADQTCVDAGDDMGFTIAIGNSGANPRAVAALDILPYHGVNGTTFSKGTECISQITEVTLQRSTADIDLSGFRIYFTQDPAARSSTSDAYRSMTHEQLLRSGWQALDLNSQTGAVTLPKEFSPSALLVLGQLPAGQTLGMHMTMHLTDDVPGDLAVNRLYESGGADAGLLQAQASTYVVSRNLSGLAWLDRNLDGIRNEQDSDRISGLTITLMKLKDGADPELESSYEPYCVPGTDVPVTAQTGYQINARTGETTQYTQGAYRFTYLPAGTFAVKFENGSGATDIGPLTASPVHRGNDSSLDSDGTGVYDESGKLLRSVILKISMPEASQMSSTLYESEHNDSGFGLKMYELPETGGSGTGAFFAWGTGLALLAAGLLLRRRKLRR